MKTQVSPFTEDCMSILKQVLAGCRNATATRRWSRLGALTGPFAALMACCLFSGCVPVSEHYQRAEAPDAAYLQGLCGGSGAPNWAYYPFHGIFVSVSLSPLQVGLHYPPGTTVRFERDALTISGWRENRPVTISAQLSAAVHAALGNSAPEEFDAMVDPMAPSGKSGYHRSSKGRGLTWANFIGRDINEPNRIVTVPMDLERATIVIPAMTINGQTYESQELSIVRKKYSGIIPVNC
jgi:hypothetical protein